MSGRTAIGRDPREWKTDAAASEDRLPASSGRLAPPLAPVPDPGRAGDQSERWPALGRGARDPAPPEVDRTEVERPAAGRGAPDSAPCGAVLAEVGRPAAGRGAPDSTLRGTARTEVETGRTADGLGGTGRGRRPSSVPAGRSRGTHSPTEYRHLALARRDADYEDVRGAAMRVGAGDRQLQNRVGCGSGRERDIRSYWNGR